MQNRICKLLIIVTVTLFFSCTKEKNASPRDFHYEYFPLKLNSVLIYDVDSTFYNNFNNSINNYKFQLKDSVVLAFKDSLSGDSIMRIDRFKKLQNSSNWTYQKTITKSKSSRIAIETVSNQTFIRLIFPAELYKEWNGNSKNNLGEQFYYISDFPYKTTINNNTFDDAILVKQIDEVNLIREDIASEVYAKNIGLVQKDVTAVDKNISTGRITHGTIYSIKIKSF